MPDGDGVDPRFDPRFQRGYESRVDAHAVPPQPSPSIIPADQPVPPPPLSDSTEPADREPPADEHFDERVQPDEGEQSTAGNRPLTALLIVGIVALGIAAGLLGSQLSQPEGITYTADTTPGEMLWNMARGVLPGPLFAGGIAALVAWLAIRASAAERE